jgi:hypothetical protein
MKQQSEAATAKLRGLLQRRFWAILRASLSFGLLVFLFIDVDFSKLKPMLADVRPELLLLYLLLPLVNMLIGAYRQYVVLHGSERSIRLRDVAQLIFTTSFLGRFTPGNVGIEVLRVYGLTRRTSDFPLAFTAVLVDRLLGMFALLGLVLLGVAWRPPGLPKAIEPLAWSCLVVLLAGTAVIMFPGLRRLTLALLPTTLLAPVRVWLAKIYSILDHFRQQPARLLWAFSVALVFQAMRCLIPALGLAAFWVSVPFPFVLAVMPIVILISMLPISIAGIGVYETAFVYFFNLVGVAPEVSLTVSIVGRLSWVLTAMPGAWIYARRGLMN